MLAYSVAWLQTHLPLKYQRHKEACALSSRLLGIHGNNMLHIGIDCNTSFCCVPLFYLECCIVCSNKCPSLRSIWLLRTFYPSRSRECDAGRIWQACVNQHDISHIFSANWLLLEFYSTNCNILLKISGNSSDVPGIAIVTSKIMMRSTTQADWYRHFHRGQIIP